MKKVNLLATLTLVAVGLFSGCNKSDLELKSTQAIVPVDGAANLALPAGTTIKDGLAPITKGALVIPAPINLGLAGNYAILAKSGITTTGVTSIVGNIGVSPIAATAMTGFGLVLDGTGQFSSSSLVTGQIYAANYAPPTPSNLGLAVLDMEAAYTDAAGRPADVTELGTGNIGGMTLAPGVYKWSGVVTIPTDVTLFGGANDVWIFQIAGGLTVASAKSVILTGGAQAKNIFWQVSGVASLGTTADFKGIILSKTSVVIQTGAVLNGRALAQTNVTLDANAITQPAL
jgi:hypothetical protein